MTLPDSTAELWEIIRAVCTEPEIELLELLAEHPSWGMRSAAKELGISLTTARDRHRSAERKIRQEVAARRGIT